MQATGYSLWLVPDANSDTHHYLRSCIRDLAAVYDTPIFEPHVTLLGGFSGPYNSAYITSLVLAAKLEPIQFSFTEVGSKGIYPQAFLAEVEQTSQVIKSNAQAKTMFGVKKKSYFPHLSLAYGDLDDSQVLALQTFLSERYPNLKERGRFKAHSVELWLTDGDIAEWKRIQSFKLGQ